MNVFVLYSFQFEPVDDSPPKRYHFGSAGTDQHVGITALAIFGCKSKTDRTPLLISIGWDDAKKSQYSIKVWNLYTMQFIHKYDGHKNEKQISALATNKSFPYVVSGDISGNIRIWDPRTKPADAEKRCSVLKEHPKVQSIAIVVQVNGRDVSKENFEKNVAIVVATSDKFVIVLDGFLKEIATYASHHTDTLLSVTVFSIIPSNYLEVASVPNGESGWDEQVVNDSSKKILSTASISHGGDTALESAPVGGSSDSFPLSSLFENALILTSSWDKTIRCWKSDKVCKILTGHTKSVTAMVTCHIFDEAYFSQRRQSSEHLNITERRPMPLLVSGSLDKTCIIWDLEKFEKMQVLTGHGDRISAVQVVGTYRTKNYSSVPLIISASDDKLVIIWDLLTGRMLRKFFHQNKISSLDVIDFNRGGIMIACGEEPDDLAVSRQALHVYNMLHIDTKHQCNTADNVISIDCTPSLLLPTGQIASKTDYSNKPAMVVGCVDGNCRIFDIESGISRGEFQVQEDKNKNARVNAVLIYTPPNPTKFDGELLFIALGDGTLSLWNLKSGQKLAKMEEGHSIVLFAMCIYEPHDSRKSNSVADSLYSLDRSLLITGGFDKTLCIWDLTAMVEEVGKLSQGTLDSLAPITPIGKKATIHSGPIRSLGLYNNPDGQDKCYLVTGSYDKTAILWDLAKLSPCRIFRAVHMGYVFGVAIYDPIAHCGAGGNLQLPKDCRKDPILITGGYDGYLAFYSLFQDGEKISEENLPQSNISGPNSDKQPVDHDSTSKVVTSPSSIYKKVFAHSDSITALTLYTPRLEKDDPLVVTGSIDTMVVVWNVITGQRVQTLVGHKNRVCYLCIFSLPSPSVSKEAIPNDKGRHILICGDDDKSVSVETSPNDKGRPILISGGDDKSVIVWEDALHKRPFMPSSEAVFEAFLADLLINQKNDESDDDEGGDADELFVDENDRKVAKVSISNFKRDDKTVWAITLDSGMKQHYDWPLITELVQAYKHQVFVENPYLFLLAIHEHRADFLLKFHKYLTYMIRFLPTLLTEAIAEHDLVSVRAILFAWVENCNRDIDKRLDQRLYHPSYFLPTNDLKNLAAMYPLEFVNFISGLKLVRNHSSLLEESKRKQKLHLLDRLNIFGMNDPSLEYKVTWGKLFEKRSDWLENWFEIREILLYERCSNPQSVTSVMVPLINAASIEMLVLFVEVSSLLNNVDIFDYPVGAMALKYYWDTHGRRIHLAAMIKYILCLIIFMFCIYSYQFQFQQQKDTDTIVSKIQLNVLNVAMLLIFAYYFFEEIAQCHAKFMTINKKLRSKVFMFPTDENDKIGESGKTAPVALDKRRSSIAIPKRSDTILTDEAPNAFVHVGAFVVSHFIFDIWNMVDMIVIITGIVGLSLRLAFAQDTPTGRVFLSITSILMWFKLLYFMRPFSSSGPLVAMIIQIAFSIRFFLIALFCVLAGFTQGFWLLSNMDEYSEFGTIRSSLWSSFMTMLGAMLPEFEANHNASPAFARFLLVIFMMVMIILMLNILIALMGDTFSRVRDSGLALWRKEQAAICIEEMFSAPISSASVVGGSDQASAKRFFQIWFNVGARKNVNQIIQVQPYIHVLQYTSDVGAKEPSTKLRNMVKASKDHVQKFTPLTSNANKASL